MWTRIIALSAALLLAGPAVEQPDSAFADDSARIDSKRAARVKENLVYHVAQLVTWPSESAGSTLRACFVGDEVREVAALARVRAERMRRSGKGRRFTVRTLDSSLLSGKMGASSIRSTVRGCQILYLDSSRDGASGVARALARLPVFVIGDGETFVRGAGMLGFVVAKGRVRLHIHTARAKRAGLRVSGRLLQHARIVKGGPP